MSERTCAIPECERNVRNVLRGLCEAHAQRFSKGKSMLPPVGKRLSPATPTADRLPYTVVDGCWEFSGWLDRRGYGLVTAMGEQTGAHRIAYALWVGPIPEGLGVLHHCDNPPCIRPSHLFVGTQGENMKDAAGKGRMSHGEGSGMSKLTEAEVLAIRADDRSQKAIAATYGVDPSNISRIKSRQTWNHI